MFEFILTLAEQYGLLGIFIAAFFSFFILPIPPIEALMILALKVHNPYAIFLVSLIGATLGTMCNYFIGFKGVRKLLEGKHRKSIERAHKVFEKWGPISIFFFGWMPVIGNPLIIVAGTLHIGFRKMLIYATLGKIWYFSLVLFFGFNLLNYIKLL